MKYSIKQFNEEFPNDDVCLEYIFNQKHKKKCECGGKYYRVRERKCYSCSKCRKQIYPLVGTIFEGSRTSLTLWFYAIYLFSQSKHGVSSAELERQLGVKYETAWRIAKRIRSLMKLPTKKLRGIVEADETYIGGLRKLNSWKRPKVPLMGIVQRGGSVIARVAPNHTEYSIVPFVENNVRKGSLLFTDGAPVYKIVQGVKHDQVIHSKKEYVRGMVHTCTIDGYWGYLKNSLRGTHKQVSRRHLQSYVDSFAFSWNHRHGDPFASLMKRL